jgi:hypothetical protein
MKLNKRLGEYVFCAAYACDAKLLEMAAEAMINSTLGGDH